MTKLLFTKTDIAKMLNISQKYLERNLSQNVKNRVDWKTGQQKFTEELAVIIICYFRPLSPPENNIKLVQDYRDLS